MCAAVVNLNARFKDWKRTARVSSKETQLRQEELRRTVCHGLPDHAFQRHKVQGIVRHTLLRVAKKFREWS